MEKAVGWGRTQSRRFPQAEMVGLKANRKGLFCFPHCVAELTAATFCGCQRSTWVQKAIRQIHGRKVHQGLIKHSEVDPSSNLGPFKLQITEKCGGVLAGNFLSLLSLFLIFISKHPC